MMALIQDRFRSGEWDASCSTPTQRRFLADSGLYPDRVRLIGRQTRSQVAPRRSPDPHHPPEPNNECDGQPVDCRAAVDAWSRYVRRSANPVATSLLRIGNMTSGLQG